MSNISADVPKNESFVSCLLLTNLCRCFFFFIWNINWQFVLPSYFASQSFQKSIFFFSRSSQHRYFLSYFWYAYATFTVWQPFTRWIPMCTFRSFHDRIYGSNVQLKCNHKQIPKANSQCSLLKRNFRQRILVDAPQRCLSIETQKGCMYWEEEHD